MHDLKLVRSISSSERRLPFVKVCYARAIVGPAKIALGEDADGAKTVYYIRDKWEWIPILLGDLLRPRSSTARRREPSFFLIKGRVGQWKTAKDG